MRSILLESANVLLDVSGVRSRFFFSVSFFSSCGRREADFFSGVFFSEETFPLQKWPDFSDDRKDFPKRRFW